MFELEKIKRRRRINKNMVVVDKIKKNLININNVSMVSLDKNKIITKTAKDMGITRILLAEYEDEEVAKTAFNQLIEAIEQCDEIFYMPE